MKFNYTKILAISAGILMIVYLLYQTVFASISSIKTETAIDYTAEEIIKTEGYIIRDETVITCDDAVGGVLSYEIADGSRVSKGGTVAGIYNSENDVEIKAQIASLDKQIKNLSGICNMDMSNVTNLDQVDGQIDESLIELLDSVAGGDYSKLATNSDEYLTLLNKRLVAIGAETDFYDRLSRLNTQKSALESRLGIAKNVVSEKAGYFVSSVDGYENVLTSDSIETLTKVDLEGIKPNEQTDKTIVGDALVENGLIEGDEGDFGLYVKKVNGITADYDVDGTYWAFYENGAYAATGVDKTTVVSGTTYEFRVEK